nr:putative ribonuclease H-like domain-containing protein [Tanacetum cinerariifolium]
MASSTIPQIDCAPTVHQHSKFSSPKTRLVVLVFQKGDDPIDTINHMMSFLTAVVTLSTVKFGNDLVAKIIGRFCDSDLEVTFRQHTCFIRNLDGVDLLTGSQGNNLYTLSLQDMMATKKTHKPKSEDTNQEKLYLLHMDLYGPMRVESVNGKKYIIVIVDDYSCFTWVKFLRSKDETLDFIIKFLKIIEVRLKVQVRRIRIDNGTEFVNQTLRDYYEEVGISHETSVVRSPQQNGVVERCNHILIEAARTMLIYYQAPLFLWAEAVATACFTQNRSIIRHRHGKTPYELLHISLFHMFGALCYPALCYPTNDSENLGLQSSQSPRGIFINQSNYALESLKKYGFESCDRVDTPMVEKSKLDEDKEEKAVDLSHYHCMIGTLLYLIANRPDLQFAICMCARYQARPTEKHDSSVALTAFAVADHAGCQDTRQKKVKNGVIELYFVNTEYQLADLFTKALSRDRIEFLINKLGMRSFTPEMLKQLMDEVDE